MIKAVLFDFDGVIVSSEEIHRLTFIELLSKEVSQSRWYSEFAGTGSRKIFKKLLDEDGKEADMDELVEKRRGMFNEHVDAGEAKEISGLSDFLYFLREKNIKIAIVSGGHRGYIEKLIDMLGIADYFDYIVTADDVPYRKPDPKPFLMAAEFLGIPPEDCLVIEDSYSGCQAARSAGMKLIWMRPYPEMNAPVADQIIDDFTDKQIFNWFNSK